MSKMILSFYCDDTNPYCAPPEALKTFLDFASNEGIAGESSAILGYSWHGTENGLLSRPTTDIQAAFVEQLRRSYDCGIDTHCELMTHWGRFDFEEMRMPADAIHEGLWLYEPDVSVAEYEAYFAHILDEGERIGVRFTGLTWPGCGCDACQRRYQELQDSGITEPNPNFWQALLRLAQQDRFRGRTVPCFFGNGVDDCAERIMARAGDCAVYDLPPNGRDRFGVWLNAAEEVDADYYITADGKAGRIVDLVRGEAPYCLFYAHWQGLNPGNGVGWDAFTRVVRRVQRYLRDEVVWMRPSEMTDHFLRAQY